MKHIPSLLKEIKKHLTNKPSFLLEKYFVPSSMHSQSQYVGMQIEDALKSDVKFIFLLGPFGCGKTTHLFHFLRKNKKLNYKYRSFIRINNLDFSFYHLTNYWSRTILISLGITMVFFMFTYFPLLAAFPVAVILGSVFMKNSAHLVYLIHEVCRSLFSRKQKVVMIEDLERSSVSEKDQWALLTNLWQYQYKYLITFGYPQENKEAKEKIIENITKLGGTIIEIPLEEAANYQLISEMDPEFPFTLPSEASSENKGWLSLFTFREIITFNQLVKLRVQPEKNQNNLYLKQIEYIKICLELLLDKINLATRQIVFAEEAKKITWFNEDTISANQLHYLASFVHSIIPELNIELEEAGKEKASGKKKVLSSP